jgi:hypothetical protein
MLLPRICKIIGRILWFPAVVLAGMVHFNHYVIPFLDFRDPPGRVTVFIDRRYDYSDEVTITLLIIALVFLAFGKRKDESLLTKNLRQRALYWSVSISWASTALYFVLRNFFNFLGTSSLADFFVMIVDMLVSFNVLIPLVIFFPIFWYLRRTVQSAAELKQLYLLPYPLVNRIGKYATLLLMLFGILVELFLSTEVSYAAIMMFFPLALVAWICTKEFNEDSALYHKRLEAMQLSIFIQHTLFLITYWLIYGWDYADALACSVVSCQLIFLMVFYWMRYKAPKKAAQGAIAEAS